MVAESDRIHPCVIDNAGLGSVPYNSLHHLHIRIPLLRILAHIPRIHTDVDIRRRSPFSGKILLHRWMYRILVGVRGGPGLNVYWTRRFILHSEYCNGDTDRNRMRHSHIRHHPTIQEMNLFRCEASIRLYIFYVVFE